jgi:hypothetical protein
MIVSELGLLGSVSTGVFHGLGAVKRPPTLPDELVDEVVLDEALPEVLPEEVVDEDVLDEDVVLDDEVEVLPLVEALDEEDDEVAPLLDEALVVTWPPWPPWPPRPREASWGSVSPVSAPPHAASASTPSADSSARRKERRMLCSLTRAEAGSVRGGPSRLG